MPALAAVVADLLARPRPLLCLDTCDLLDIIQCVAEGKARRLEHIRRLLGTLALRPDGVQLVVTYLVPVEWAQNYDLDVLRREFRERLYAGQDNGEQRVPPGLQRPVG